MKDRERRERVQLMALYRGLEAALGWGTNSQVEWHLRYMLKVITRMKKETPR